MIGTRQIGRCEGENGKLGGYRNVVLSMYCAGCIGVNKGQSQRVGLSGTFVPNCIQIVDRPKPTDWTGRVSSGAKKGWELLGLN